MNWQGKETGKLRKQRTINELVEIYKSLQQTDQKVTQKLLETHSTISIRTIKRQHRFNSLLKCLFGFQSYFFRAIH